MNKNKHTFSLKKFLEQYKIFFETLVFLLLGLMAIILSTFQVSNSNRQNELINKQKEIANFDLKYKLLQYKLNEWKQWNELKNVMRKANFQFLPYPGERDFIRKMNRKEQLVWLMNYEQIISPIGSNDFVLENKFLFENYLALNTSFDFLRRSLRIQDSSKINMESEAGIFYNIWRFHFTLSANIITMRSVLSPEDSMYHSNKNDSLHWFEKREIWLDQMYELKKDLESNWVKINEP